MHLFGFIKVWKDLAWLQFLGWILGPEFTQLYHFLCRQLVVLFVFELLDHVQFALFTDVWESYAV